MQQGMVHAVARLAALALALALVVGSTTPVGATPIIATPIIKTSAMYPEPLGSSNAYTGIHDEHWEEEPFGLLPPGCGKNFTQEPVYRPKYVAFNSRDFVEVAIAFPCQGERFWWGAYQDLNGFHILFHDTINTPPLGQDNNYEIFRLAEFWDFKVNGALKARMFWNAVGNYVESGLEVFRAEVYSQYVVHHTLRKTISESPWIVWNGVASADAGMCSIPITQDSFKEKRPFSGTGC